MAKLQVSPEEEAVADGKKAFGAKKQTKQQGEGSDLYKIVRLVMDRALDPAIVFSFAKKWVGLLQCMCWWCRALNAVPTHYVLPGRVVGAAPVSWPSRLARVAMFAANGRNASLTVFSLQRPCILCEPHHRCHQPSHRPIRRRECEGNALQMSKLDFNDDSEKTLVEQVFGNAMESLADEDRQLPQVCTVCIT